MLTPEQKVLISLEAAISAYEEYALNDPFKKTRIKDWKLAVKNMRDSIKKVDNK